MPDFSLVPVDHQPDFADVSLVPVEHDPFSADDVIQQARSQPATQPQRLATIANESDKDTPDSAWGDIGRALPEATADFRKTLLGQIMGGLISLPQRAIDASAQDMQHFGEEGYTQQAIGPAVETALMMAGAGAPMAESGAVGALGGKPPRLGAVESSKILPEELAGHTRSQIPDLAVDKGPGQSAEDVASGTAATEQTAPAVVEGGLSAHGPTGKYYSVVREHKLRPESYPGVSRPAHNQEANEAFLRDMAGYDDYARDMRNFGIYLWRTPTGLAPRTPPAGFSWHHHLEEPGLLQLVPRKQHDRGSIFQDVLHPNGRGGYSKWGK